VINKKTEGREAPVDSPFLLSQTYERDNAHTKIRFPLLVSAAPTLLQAHQAQLRIESPLFSYDEAHVWFGLQDIDERILCGHWAGGGVETALVPSLNEGRACPMRQSKTMFGSHRAELGRRKEGFVPFSQNRPSQIPKPKLSRFRF
jgi:hypothetical protein